MEVSRKNNIKKILPVMVLLAVLLLSTAGTADGSEQTPDGSEQTAAGRKIIVLLLDGLSLSDLEDYPNLRGLTASSGLGLINTRTQSLTSFNRASGYLTMGMGIRTQVAEPENGYKVEQVPLTGGDGKRTLGQLRNIDAAALNEMVKREYPNYTLGKIGEVARSYGLKVALVGNSDTDRPDNDASLLAMDKSGSISFGNTSRSLLVKDPDFAWGFRTDTGELLASTLEAFTISDVTFVDFGDTGRVSAATKSRLYEDSALKKYKTRALNNADFFLGRLLSSVDWQKTTLIVVSPTPPVNEPSKINNSLAPIIIYEKNSMPGVLASGTTRRDGLVANIDIGPSIFDTLGYDSNKLNFLGEKITTIPNPDNLDTISQNLAQYLRLKTSRYIVHGVYVILIVAALISLYLSIFDVQKMLSARSVRTLALMVLTWPASALLVTAGAQQKTYYLYLGLAGLVTVGLSLLFSKTAAGALAGMGWVSLSSALFLVFDAFGGLRLLHNTPLGFNDVFSGGRYYGMNNDCMGILLGSTVFALFYWSHRTGLSRPLRVLTGAACLLTVIATQTPSMGANVGGTIAAMTTGVVSVMILALNNPPPKKRVLIIVALVFMVEIGIAYYDYLTGSHTHAGKVLGTLISEGFGSKFLEILKSKLSLFGVMLVLPPWNILFAAELYILYLVKGKMQHIIDFVQEAYPAQFRSSEAVFYSGLVAFAFNDTGIIATAIIFTYLTMPLTVILSTRSGDYSAKLNI